ncbi:unnamed protein product [Caenorhabditis brenneri]
MGENRQGPQRRSMAQASGPSSDVQGTSPPSRTATAAVSVTPALAASSLAPSDPRRSTRSTTVAAGASITATDTPSTSGLRRFCRDTRVVETAVRRVRSRPINFNHGYSFKKESQ